ncbi:MAG: hypothetical protein SFU25_10550, partial [Candidatus Caenarcaniphilales bacterium]|nr:hypothetical protein [Candidatus Caenarcaniphilales bacterium]
FLYEEEHFQHTLDLEGFEGLWQATESTLPFFTSYQSNNDKLIAEQQEQLHFMAQEINALKSENFELKQEMADLIRSNQAIESLQADYSYLIELNRTLTKQLNSLMQQREKEKSRIQALRELLG